MVEKHLDNLISTQSEEEEIELFPSHAVMTVITAAVFVILAVLVPVLNLVGGLMWSTSSTYFWNGVQIINNFRTFEEMAGLVPILVDPEEGTMFLQLPYGWVYGLLLLWRIPFLVLPLLGAILYAIPAIYKLTKKEPPSYELPIRIGTKINKINVFSTEFGMILALIGVGVQWLLYLLLLLNLPSPKPNINLFFVLICGISVLTLVGGHFVWQWENEWTRYLNFWTSKTAFYIFVAGVVIFCTFPFIWTVIQSFQDPSYTAGVVEYIPSRPGLANYGLVFDVFDFQVFIINSFITATTTTLLCVAIGAFGGYVLAQFHFKLKTIILGAILSMTMFPGIVILIPLYVEYLFIADVTEGQLNMVSQPPLYASIQSFAFLILIIAVVVLAVMWIIKIYRKTFEFFKSRLEIGAGIVIVVSAIIFLSSLIFGGFLSVSIPLSILLLAFVVFVVAVIYSGVNLILHWSKYKEINTKYLIAFIVSNIFGVVLFLLPALLTPDFYASTIAPLTHPQLGLLIPYITFNLPLTLFLLYNFFQEIPSELVKAARVDGASNFQVFWQVIFPLAIPGVFTTAILVFIAAWNEYLFASILLSNNDEWTIPVAMSLFAGIPPTGLSYNPSLLLNAATVIVTLPLIIIVLIFQKQIIAGITAGAIKG
ncbi:MAG: carbohydrate ABC transporter permease [Promethearchaeota archaeon]